MRRHRNQAASARARLANLAREEERPFQELLQYFAIERFLYRLSQSRFGQQFVLKGGIVFFGWGLPLRRPTRDIDLFGHMPSSVADLEDIVREVCQLDVEPDGMVFDAVSVSGEEIQLNADYPGIRVKFFGKLGSARVPMQLDVNFTDAVEPPAVEIDYPTLLDMPHPQLLAYSYATLIAEKLHAIVFLDRINSRMKDFYDIWFLAREATIDGRELQQAIAATFQNRRTELPRGIPYPFTTEFVADKQTQWSAFINRVSEVESDTRDFDNVINVLRALLIPVLDALREGTNHQATWLWGRQWVFGE